jgi:hypothetical protein
MSDDHLPHSAADAFNRALKAADENSAREDEDYVGLPLPEPSAPAVPGLAIGLFPTAGRLPGGPNLVYPAKLIIRVALFSTEMRFDKVTEPLPVPVEGPEGSLGSLDDLARLSIADRQRYRAQYIAALDDVAQAVASGQPADPGYRDITRRNFERLREKALAASYAAMAPLFHAWLYGN